MHRLECGHGPDPLTPLRSPAPRLLLRLLLALVLTGAGGTVAAQEPPDSAAAQVADPPPAGPDPIAALADSLARARALFDTAGAAQAAPSPYDVDPDADGDGIPVFADWCPDSAPGDTVDERGCSVDRLPWWGWAALVAGVLGLATLVRGLMVGAYDRRRRARIARYGRETDHEVERIAHSFGGGGGASLAPWMAEAPLLDEEPDPSDPVREAPPGRRSATSPGVPAPPPWSGAPAGIGYPAPAGGPPTVELDLQGRSVPPGLMGPTPFEVASGYAPPPPPPRRDPFAAPSASIPRGITEWQQSPLRFDGEEGRRRRLSPALLTGLALILAATTVAVVVRVRTGSDALGGPVVSLAEPPSQPVVVAFSDEPADPEAEPGTVPARMVLVGGDGQQAPAGARLVDSIAVRVEDAAGVPVPRVRIYFESTAGGGTVSPILAFTDSSGVARAAWRLGRAAEQQYVTARVEGYEDGAGVAFAATAVAGQAAGVRLLAGADQTGTPNLQLDSALVLMVTDAQGNPVPGVTVEFDVGGSGSVSPTSAETDSTGVVRAWWTLGEGAAQPTLEARVRDQPALSAAATATLVYPRLGVQAGVVTGGTHTCQLAGTGRLRCWGSNQTGQLGNGSTGGSRVPVSAAAEHDFSSVAAGLAHTCGVTSEGRALCWGDNASGQLGTGDGVSHTDPTPVVTEVRFRQIAAGPAHTCAVSRGGQGWCWGSNANGQLGDGSRTDRANPVRIALNRPLQEISTGWTHTCALATDGAAFCWGRNAFGQLGDGGTEDHLEPGRVDSERGFRHIAAGSAHTCAVASDGALACWGQNNYGQLGTGDTDARNAPTRVDGGPWRAVATGGVHTCALAMGGEVWCWGRNTYGQLGDGTLEDRRGPVAVTGGLTFTAVQASGAHTCATEASGRTHCWGFNVEGQLGDGTRTNRSEPARVGGG
ncbi:MAG: Ig-like domain-containing protein [Gemmatimonadota bacterium]|nr:Ig-like domain-containing protein [Gemmatimonadota bacterium]